MSFQDNLEELTKLQENLLNFLDEEEGIEENFANLIALFEYQNIQDKKYNLKLFLLLLARLSNDHQHKSSFYFNIQRILEYFKSQIIKYYTNSEIFRIFKSNKRILLYLIKEKIIELNGHIVQAIISNEKLIKANYIEYFAPEIKAFIDEPWFPEKQKEMVNKELPETFEDDRQFGQNSSQICKFIQTDSIIEFTTFVNKNNYPLSSKIEPSIYETNSFLINNSPNLIEYAAFYGSIQIFQYLKINNVPLTPSLWLYTIHSNKPELIHLLEDDHVEIKDTPCEKLIINSIKCHNNNIANYFQNNFVIKNDENYSKTLVRKSLKFYNFSYLKESDLIQSDFFYDLCNYDYYEIVELLMKNGDVDINCIRYINHVHC